MTHATHRLPLLLATSLLVAACGGTTTQPPDGEETAVDPRPSSSPSSDSSIGTPADVARAVEDLAATLDLTTEEVEVVSTEEVTWRDGSRGCAQPGEMYTQALVHGLRIVLRAGEQTYEYHSGGSRPPTPCERPTE